MSENFPLSLIVELPGTGSINIFLAPLIVEAEE
jgi:hypothetical protein